MKKVLLASAVALSILGYTQTTAQAQENKAESVRENVTIPHSSTSKIENQEKSKEKVEKTDNSSKIDDKEEKTEKKTPATEEKKSEVKKEEKVEKVKEGWQEENNNWRFYEHNKPVTNWKKIQGKWYYFNKDGHRLSNTTFDGYVFNKDGVMAENGWNFINGKWYFANSSGKISQNKWEKIGGAWYYFDKDGIMLSNTTFDNYLLTKSGAMATNGWAKIDQNWYYATSSGKISQDKWEKVNGSWYYFDKKGIMLSSTTFKGYLFNNSGAMAENSWVKIKDTWFYANASGKFVQNKWEKISGSWYSFAQDGAMLADKWSGSYYLKTNGAMADNEWIFDKNYNSWFFLKRGGMYASKEWIGAYYLKAGGYMAKKEWIYDDTYKARYYLDDNGHYVSGTYKIDGKDHLFHKNGQWISEVSKEVGFVKGQYSRTIFLDPGHGGRDSGAYYYNVAEKDLNMQVYRKLRKKLEELGYKVLTSRDSDIDVDFVTERSRMVNKTNSDIFISIHFNATGSAYSRASGIQTYSYSDDPDYPSKINPYWHNHPDRMSESKRLAAAIHSSLLAETGAKDAGLLERSFAVLRETAKPAVLLELGYIDNFAENQQIRDSHYQDKLVAGIVKGIQKYYAGK
ncbi:putative endo-beta-N-acetylglucosaminidase precursor [Streptococcus mitis]|jgi:putative surface protein|uniref:Putative endo-beta-N-acetylglucosaminidase n=1 Tax=Streptococcus mitis TaxID=28037 RepID=A0A3R9JGC6_STRMT|nr:MULTISPECIES: N-acetylmuramoyl-L-alanine amidase [Streptococcus]RSI79647.1 putative endo-beta-N-acetylglucosaminidase precursor [Streptococcus mitis]